MKNLTTAGARTLLHAGLCAGLCAGVASPAFAAPMYTITDLSAIGGGVGSVVTDINENGQITGSYIAPDGETRAYIADDTGFYGLGALGGNYSRATAINDAGQIVGRYAQGVDGFEKTRAFIGDVNGIRPIDGLGNGTSTAYDINNNGVAAGFTGGLGERQGFVADDDGASPIGTVYGGESVAGAINDSGEVTGFTSAPASAPGGAFFDRAIVGDAQGLTDLGTTVGGISSNGYAINASGQIAGEGIVANGRTHAVVDTSGGLVDLGTLAGDNDSTANGISDRGQVVGTSQIGVNDGLRAFVTDGNRKVYELNNRVTNPTGVENLGRGKAITAEGNILSFGTPAGGGKHYFLLEPVAPTGIDLPEPSPLTSDVPADATLPTPPNVFTDSAAEFIADATSSFSDDVRSYYDSALVSLGQQLEYSPYLKESANVAAIGIKSAATGIDLAVSTTSELAADALGQLGLWSLNDLNDTQTDARKGLEAVIAGGDVAGVLASFQAGNTTVGLVQANTFIWGSIVAPQLKQFGEDPPDPRYTEFYRIADQAPTFPFGTTGDSELDATGASLLRSSYRAAQYLNGANRSFDRYTTAYNAGDRESAAFQLGALLYYIAQYKGEAGRNATLTDRLLGQLPSNLMGAPLAGDRLAAIQQELANNGFSSDLLSVFDAFDLSGDDISQIKNKIFDLTEDDFLELSIRDDLAQIQGGFERTASRPPGRPVPAPNGLPLLLLGLMLIVAMGVYRSRRVAAGG